VIDDKPENKQTNDTSADSTSTSSAQGAPKSAESSDSPALSTNTLDTKNSDLQESKAPKSNAKSGANKSNAQKHTVEKKPQAKSGGHGLSLFLFLLILLTIGASGYFGYMLWSNDQAQNAELSKLQNQLAETELALRNTNNIDTQLSAQLSRMVEAQNNQSKQHKATFDNIHERLNSITGATRQDWLVAEAEYLLRIANQRLFLEKDPATAQSLLEAADTVLADSGDSSLMPVRIQIAEELLQLRQQSTGEIDSLLVRLNALANSLPALNLGLLPAKSSQQSGSETAANAKTVQGDDGNLSDTAGTTTNGWQSLKNKLSAALRSLVTIQRKEQIIKAPPSPEYSIYIKQNLALRIEQAKLLLMRHRFSDFEATLTAAANWTEHLVATPNNALKHVSAELLSIADAKPSESSVDISGSLKALQKNLEVKYRNHSLEKHSSADDLSTDSLSTDNPSAKDLRSKGNH